MDRRAYVLETRFTNTDVAAIVGRVYGTVITEVNNGMEDISMILHAVDSLLHRWPMESWMPRPVGQTTVISDLEPYDVLRTDYTAEKPVRYIQLVDEYGDVGIIRFTEVPITDLIDCEQPEQAPRAGWYRMIPLFSIEQVINPDNIVVHAISELTGYIVTGFDSTTAQYCESSVVDDTIINRNNQMYQNPMVS